MNQAYLREVLVPTHVEIIIAGDGKKVVELVKENPSVDLILMDIKMPVMDGLTATRVIKEHHSEIPIIAQTAYAFNADKDQALEAGCDDYITKPTERENLLKMIDKFLD